MIISLETGLWEPKRAEVPAGGGGHGGEDGSEAQQQRHHHCRGRGPQRQQPWVLPGVLHRHRARVRAPRWVEAVYEIFLIIFPPADTIWCPRPRPSPPRPAASWSCDNVTLIIALVVRTIWFVTSLGSTDWIWIWNNLSTLNIELLSMSCGHVDVDDNLWDCHGLLILST